MTRTQKLWLTYGPAALAAGGIAVALTLTSNHERHPTTAIGLGLFVGWSFILAGLIGWSRRPHNNTGILMVALGFGVFIGSLSEANQSIPFTIGDTFGGIFIVVFVHLLLAYPSGRLLTRYARRLMVTGYGLAIVLPLLDAMFQPKHQTCGGRLCPDNAFLVARNHTVHTVIGITSAVLAGAFLLAALVLLHGRWRRATPALKRILRDVYAAGALSVVLLIVAFTISPGGDLNTALFIALIIPFSAVPFLFVFRLLGTSLAGGAGVGKIFWDIPERASQDEVQEGFRKALRDPSLQLAYWYPEGGHYVDVAGERLDLPEETSRVSVTRLEYADEPVAALVHDAALRDEPELLNAVAGAARIALDRDRLLVEVRARASRYRALLEAMPDLMFRISLEGRYLGYNAPNERDLISRDVVGQTLWERLPKELADRIIAAGRRAVDDQMTQTLEYDLELGGELRRYEGRIAASGEDEFLLIVRDITERKVHEEELQASRSRIVAAGDEARRRLERDLHDGAQQRLVSISLSLRLARNQLRSAPEATEKLLEASHEELAQALNELRELARGIHPAILTDRGLDAALEALAARAPLPVEIEGVCSDLPAPVEAAAYYVVSEALTNVAKYAQARSVRVTLAQTNGCARVEVADDGIGGADPAGGTGLRGLADRVESLNGTLEVESPSGGGTRIRAEIPLGVG